MDSPGNCGTSQSNRVDDESQTFSATFGRQADIKIWPWLVAIREKKKGKVLQRVVAVLI